MEEERLPLMGHTDSSEPQFGLVPEDRTTAYRTLVMCFDGTGDQEDDDVTNVIELRNMLYGWDPKDNESGGPELQKVYYGRGIGTEEHALKVYGTITSTLDKAIAWNLDDHVKAGYEWLAENYRKGDKICLFGFSRGAYIVRALAGMLSKVGLMPKSSPKDTSKEAFMSYERSGGDGWKDSEEFRKKTNCRNVVVEFMGCWDTVNSVGVLQAKALPYTAYNKIVRNFRHAVSLDEHRARFRTNMWGRPRNDNFEKKMGSSRQGSDTNRVANSNGVATAIQANAVNGEVRNRDIHGPIVNGQHHLAPTGEDLDANTPEPPVTVKTDADEVWFAGAHCDVGGGSVPNGTRPNLAHIPLRWMIRECFITKSGIIFKKSKLETLGLDPGALYPVVQRRPPAVPLEPKMDTQKGPGMWSRFGSWVKSWNPFGKGEKPKVLTKTRLTEEELDTRDALAQIYDQLALKPWKWAALEYLWTKTWSVSQNKWVHRQNKGRGRRIPPPLPLPKDGQIKGDPRLYEVRVHRTVRTRMEAVGKDGKREYEPKALLDGKDGMTLSRVDEMKLVNWVD